MVLVEQRTVRRREWTTAWRLLLLGIYVAYAVYAIYMYREGKRGNARYRSWYILLRHPSWQHFKDWLAQVANDPQLDILLTFAFVLIPIPFLPYYVHGRLEVLLAKLGLFYLLVTLILGKPRYNSQDPGESRTEYLAGWAFLGVLVVVTTGSFLVTRLSQ
jgi:hypothetical protein